MAPHVCPLLSLQWPSVIYTPLHLNGRAGSPVLKSDKLGLLMTINFINIRQIGLLLFLLFNTLPSISTVGFKMQPHLNGIVKLQSILSISSFSGETRWQVQKGRATGWGANFTLSDLLRVDHFNSQPFQATKQSLCSLLRCLSNLLLS